MMRRVLADTTQISARKMSSGSARSDTGQGLLEGGRHTADGAPCQLRRCGAATPQAALDEAGDLGHGAFAVQSCTQSGDPPMEYSISVNEHDEARLERERQVGSLQAVEGILQRVNYRTGEVKLVTPGKV